MRNHIAAASILLACCSLPALAAEPFSADVSIREHRFHPAELTVPTDQKIKLTVINEDASVEEFESYDLNREKIIPGGGRITVWIGPLQAGDYRFFGEFNQDTAQGILHAVAP